MKNCCTELPGSDVLNWLTSEVNGILKDAPINASVRYSQYPDYVRKFNGISEVVGIVPTKDRAFGKALTFMNSEGNMELWYFKGSELSLWEDLSLWEKADYSEIPVMRSEINVINRLLSGGYIFKKAFSDPSSLTAIMGFSGHRDFYILGPGQYPEYVPYPGEEGQPLPGNVVPEGSFRIWIWNGTTWSNVTIKVGGVKIITDDDGVSIEDLNGYYGEGQILAYYKGGCLYICQERAWSSSGFYNFIFSRPVYLDSGGSVLHSGHGIGVDCYMAYPPNGDETVPATFQHRSINIWPSEFVTKEGPAGQVFLDYLAVINELRVSGDLFVSNNSSPAIISIGGLIVGKYPDIIPEEEEPSQGLLVYNGPLKIQDNTENRQPTLQFIRGIEGDNVLDGEIVADSSYIRIRREFNSTTKRDLLKIGNSHLYYHNNFTTPTVDEELVGYVEGDSRPNNVRPGTEFFNTSERALYKYMGGAWQKIWQDPNV